MKIKYKFYKTETGIGCIGLTFSLLKEEKYLSFDFIYHRLVFFL